MLFYTEIYQTASVMLEKDLVNLRKKEVVKLRLESLKFWNEYGLRAAIAHANVSRSTLYSWRKSFTVGEKESKQRPFSLKNLDPQTTRPKHCRRRKWDIETIRDIEKLVNEHPELGKNKIYHILKRKLKQTKQLNRMVSESTIGRILKHLRENNNLPATDEVRIDGATGKLRVNKRRIKKKIRRNMLPKVVNPGDLLQIDGVEGYFEGRHYYIVNAIDYISEKVVSRAYRTKASANMAEFLSELPAKMGFKFKAIQTDNGSEYAALFHTKAEEMGIIHCFNYVRKPIYNGKVERFNRTLQEALLNDVQFAENLAYDLNAAQRQIDDYLAFYNNERPHFALKFSTPSEYVLEYLKRIS